MARFRHSHGTRFLLRFFRRLLSQRLFWNFRPQFAADGSDVFLVRRPIRGVIGQNVVYGRLLFRLAQEQSFPQSFLVLGLGRPEPKLLLQLLLRQEKTRLSIFFPFQPCGFGLSPPQKDDPHIMSRRHLKRASSSSMDWTRRSSTASLASMTWAIFCVRTSVETPSKAAAS